MQKELTLIQPLELVKFVSEASIQTRKSKSHVSHVVLDLQQKILGQLAHLHVTVSLYKNIIFQTDKIVNT